VLSLVVLADSDPLYPFSIGRQTGRIEFTKFDLSSSSKAIKAIVVVLEPRIIIIKVQTSGSSISEIR
jgi:hypothetical protein